MTILIVEDNEMNRDMLARRLRRVGFDIVIAETGLDGVRRAHETLPDLILMDLSLPDLDGWEATRRVKASASTRHIPVIALTAHALEEERERAFDAGCDDFQTKPVDFARLLERIGARVHP